ncbi:Oidioi.mRNA.OKI2018_I69.XSR.g16513.t2.cds [Oikopleura dioica]|nr:Oidioi.mRNA.OKI2018_I69.XSR.g16513.t2.cds [Oikopleura dioica]
MLNEAMDKMLAELTTKPKTAAGEGNQGHIHDVLDTIKKEQDIYDVVFYEIIRQVTVDCKERGQLLSKLRRAYSDLLGRIPEYVGGIHSELIAQRVLDGKLTSQILFFKSEIDRLGNELQIVKDHDKSISEEAETSKKELQYAMSESAKSAAVLEEYHQLYELQRERLQKHIKKITTEREIWNTAAYSLAIKLVDENELSVARRIYVSERAWSKLARHFAVFLAERDSNDLNLLQMEVHRWRDTASNLKRLSQTKNNKARELAKELFQELAKVMEEFKKKFIYIDFAGGRRAKEPDLNSADQLIEDFEFVTIKLGKFIHTFDNSDPLAGKCGKYLEDMEQRLNNWTDIAVEIYSRHRSPTDQKHAQHNIMTDLNEKIIRYHHQMVDKNTGQDFSINKNNID